MAELYSTLKLYKAMANKWEKYRKEDRRPDIVPTEGWVMGTGGQERLRRTIGPAET